jgi:hypothetical protein
VAARVTSSRSIRVAMLALFLLPSAAGCHLHEGTVRARAASDFGCNESEIEVEEIPGSTYRATGCGQSNEYTCTMGRGLFGPEEVCVSDNSHPRSTGDAPSRAAPPAPPSPPPAAALGEPPSGAGGFTFGSGEDDTRHTCEQAGHTYGAGAAGSASCDGVAADVGAPARAGLTYCGGKLCAVSLKVDLAAGETIARALAHWKAALVERYGDATRSQVNVPSACNEDVTPCLLDRSGTIRFDWHWKSLQRISLSPQVDEAKKAWVSISYTAAEAARARAPGL